MFRDNRGRKNFNEKERLPDNSAKTNSAKPTRPDLFLCFFLVESSEILQNFSVNSAIIKISMYKKSDNSAK